MVCENITIQDDRTQEMDESFFISLTRTRDLDSRIVIDQDQGRSPSMTLTVSERGERERERETSHSWSSGLGSRPVDWEVERSRLPLSHFLFNRTFTQGLKIIGRKRFIWHMQHIWDRWWTPNWPCFESRSAHGLLSLAHPILGQDAPHMPDGNALALFNDFS